MTIGTLFFTQIACKVTCTRCVAKSPVQFSLSKSGFSEMWLPSARPTQHSQDCRPTRANSPFLSRRNKYPICSFGLANRVSPCAQPRRDRRPNRGYLSFRNQTTRHSEGKFVPWSASPWEDRVGKSFRFQRRTPPRKAVILCPRRLPGGSAFTFLALPPPRTR